MCLQPQRCLKVSVYRTFGKLFGNIQVSPLGRYPLKISPHNHLLIKIPVIMKLFSLLGKTFLVTLWR